MSPHKEREGDFEPIELSSQLSTLTDEMLHCHRSPTSLGPCCTPPPRLPSVDVPSPPVGSAATRTPIRPRQIPSCSMLLQARQRERFLIFMRILFKSLNEREPHLHARAKRLVVECTRRNRAGDPDYEPLMAAVESRLRTMVGEAHWRRASAYLSHYMTHVKQKKAYKTQAI